MLRMKCSELIKFPYFADTTQRVDKGVKAEDEERVTLQIILIGTEYSDPHGGVH